MKAYKSIDYENAILSGEKEIDEFIEAQTKELTSMGEQLKNVYTRLVYSKHAKIVSHIESEKRMSGKKNEDGNAYLCAGEYDLPYNEDIWFNIGCILLESHDYNFGDFVNLSRTCKRLWTIIYNRFWNEVEQNIEKELIDLPLRSPKVSVHEWILGIRASGWHWGEMPLKIKYCSTCRTVTSLCKLRGQADRLIKDTKHGKRLVLRLCNDSEVFTLTRIPYLEWPCGAGIRLVGGNTHNPIVHTKGLQSPPSTSSSQLTAPRRPNAPGKHKRKRLFIECEQDDDEVNDYTERRPTKKIKRLRFSSELEASP
jgi:hypothetical protein